MLIQDLLRRTAKLYPDQVAVRDRTVDGRKGKLTWAALARRAARQRTALAAAGVGDGDRVAVLARNHAEFVALYCSVPTLGAVLVPLNTRLKAPELRWIVEHARPKVVLVDADLAPLLDGLPTPVEGGPRVVRLDEGPTRADPEGGWVDELGQVHAPEIGSNPDRVAIQMYTSGTSGRPKGALLTHANVLALIRAWLLDMPLVPGRSRFLQVTPLFHVGGMMMLVSCVMTGASLVLLPEFDPELALDTLEERRITHALFVPSMVRWMLEQKQVGRRSFPDLELIVYGASPMPLETLRAARKLFRCDFLQGYGLTETSGVLLTLRPEDHVFDRDDPAVRRLQAAGREVQCSEVRVVDEHGRDVEPGRTGEIVARGDNVSPGYDRDEEATRQAFRDGWFHTGDLATVDEDGYVYVVDRLKDMLCVGGENVYPREVERVLTTHPDVFECAVIGVPHDVWGEEVLALVVPRPGREPGARELIRHCRAELARFKCPTRVELREHLPRNAAGKLLKQELREPYWRGRTRRV